MAPTALTCYLSFMSVGCAVSLSASGQAFNIDVGSPASSTLPSSAYGAASGQIGQWTLGRGGLGSVLTDINGQLSTSTFVTTGQPATLTGLGGAPEDERRLMFSGYALSEPLLTTAQIDHLNPGWYDVYVYCWSGPDYNVNGISVSTDSSLVSFQPNTSGAWPGQQVKGLTYVVAKVQVQSGGLGISYSLPLNGRGILSGVQVVPVPAPGSLLAGLGFGSMMAPRRRR